ncbi:MAG: cyclodeaminase/cyclohydrolase family protein [Methylococcales symbiont of Iophon sp. n. MRB-2018]|nr:MAG: cyclodeaminase/cyclohydrolase family protein [Methylococcales symbiont of Iophon sp. n. MRB-2018]KAF3980043.1 MAG: cyclodeaminase/cyclohydrolase family protein [Methylococcales symbiont of Iophon sp. n. MRB-2018]
MSEIKDKSIDVFLNELASKQATPGGGSAAAVMGAQAAALISMVCHLTIGKPKYAKVEKDMKQLLAKSEALREQLTAMIKADIEVFDQLMACYGLAKDTDEQKAERSVQIQMVLKEATMVPLECARASAEAIKLSQIAVEKGYVGVVSDAGVAVMSAYSALKSAALNIYINTASIKDRTFADAKLLELEQILEGAEKETKNIYQLAKSKL